MQLRTIVVGPFEVNCYLYWDESTKDAVVIDPGGDEQAILQSITQSGIDLKAILLTHGHGDHIAAVGAVKGRYEVPVYVHEKDNPMLVRPSEFVSMFYEREVTCPPADRFVSEDDIVRAGSIALRVIETPGHTPGGVCFLDEREGLLFCGDTIFCGGVGRTDLPGGNLEHLMDSIRGKILALPDAIVCLPGHGPQTTVGAERMSNPFLTGGYAV